jgi:WD40 repeat protein
MCRFITALLGFGLIAGLAVARQNPNPPMAVSPDGTRGARGDGNLIDIYDVQSNKVVIRIQAHGDKVSALAFSPDGKMLASGGLDKNLCLFDIATGKQLLKLKGEGTVEGILWGADGKTVTAREADQTMREFDVATGKVMRVYKDEKKKQ